MLNCAILFALKIICCVFLIYFGFGPFRRQQDCSSFGSTCSLFLSFRVHLECRVLLDTPANEGLRWENNLENKGCMYHSRSLWQFNSSSSVLCVSCCIRERMESEDSKEARARRWDLHTCFRLGWENIACWSTVGSFFVRKIKLKIGFSLHGKNWN